MYNNNTPTRLVRPKIDCADMARWRRFCTLLHRRIRTRPPVPTRCTPPRRIYRKRARVCVYDTHNIRTVYTYYTSNRTQYIPRYRCVISNRTRVAQSINCEIRIYVKSHSTRRRCSSYVCDVRETCLQHPSCTRSRGSGRYRVRCIRVGVCARRAYIICYTLLVRCMYSNV